ncbi:MAG: oligopeptide/dipeptide ABC transporter ATP-binding protein [Rhodospirillaceae bacterium]
MIAAIPVPDPEKRHDSVPLQGETPSALSPPPGCPFHPRCVYAIDACRAAVPPLEPMGAESDHTAACIRKHEI